MGENSQMLARHGLARHQGPDGKRNFTTGTTRWPQHKLRTNRISAITLAADKTEVVAEQIIMLDQKLTHLVINTYKSFRLFLR